MALKHTVTMHHSPVLLNTREYWDDRFWVEEFPMTNTFTRKRMYPKKYRKGCRKFGLRVFQYYCTLLPGMTPGDFWIIGAGNLDDTKLLIIYLRTLGFTVHVADFSRVVIGGVRLFFREVLKDPIAAEENVHCCNIAHALIHHVDFNSTRVLHFCRILDHLTPEERLEIARMIVQLHPNSNEELFVSVGNHDTRDNLYWLDKWTTVYPFNTPEFFQELSEFTGYRVPTAESRPWGVFRETFRITTGWLSPMGNFGGG